MFAFTHQSCDIGSCSLNHMSETVSTKSKNIFSLHFRNEFIWRNEKNVDEIKRSSLGGLEPPTFRLTAERANRLRHRDRILCLERLQNRL